MCYSEKRSGKADEWWQGELDDCKTFDSDSSVGSANFESPRIIVSKKALI